MIADADHRRDFVTMNLQGEFIMRYEYSAHSSLGKDQTRSKYTVVSDIYKAMQSRLDGYRQSAGAVFLAVIAAVLTFDGSFLRLFIDRASAKSAPAGEHGSLFPVILAGDLVVLLICFGASFIISKLGDYFAEMTSIIYKIDSANAVFEEGAWIDGASLYPKGFSHDNAPNVGRFPEDHDLKGWRDNAIKIFLWTTMALGVSQIFFSYALIAPFLSGGGG